MSTQSIESIAGLPIEERHAIVRSWLETLTTIYEKTAAERDALLIRYEALMEGLGLDPSPECYDEYTPARLRAEGYGLRMLVERLEAERAEMMDSLKRFVHLAEDRVWPGPNTFAQARAALEKAGQS